MRYSFCMTDEQFEPWFAAALRSPAETAAARRWPNYHLYPEGIQKCLELNEEMQAIGR